MFNSLKVLKHFCSNQKLTELPTLTEDSFPDNDDANVGALADFNDNDGAETEAVLGALE